MATHFEPVSNVASLSLDFVVVGGGLGGFSVAHMLCQAGHKVRVLEKLPGLGTPAGGLRVPPNLSKILKRWVGEEELRKTAVLNVSTPWWDLHTGERMGAAAWRQDVMSETGGDFLMMAHEDVHRMVHRLAVASGAKVDFGATVVEVTPGEPRPSVTLASGEVITADIVIGADGPRSLVRKVVLGEEDDPRPEGVTVFGAVVPASYMLNDPELHHWITAQEVKVFLSSSIVSSYSIASHNEFALTIHWPDEEAGTPEDAAESWYEIVPTNILNLDSLAPLFQRMVKGASCLYRTRSMVRDDIDYWIHESERIVLLGEAAHPWVPGVSHCTSMAVEDAVVLGTLFSHLSSEDQIPRFLYAYEEMRQGRTTQVRERDVSNAAFLRMPPGPEKDARNADFRQARGEWDDGALKTEFEGLFELFGYDAYDAAEEWWVSWGRYNNNNGGGNDESNRPLSEMQFSFASMSVHQEGRDE
ncbi:FAD/NAD(P)-binding domain-containing protein [Cytidiella melzeri]|nr:FAD/NAD(P)-binding domain-containing protein [Cytidiella melzeri]